MSLSESPTLVPTATCLIDCLLYDFPVIFDITHSTQLPASAEGGKTSGGDRRFAPVLARAATATGYVDGYFLEVHPEPSRAKSDKAVQLSLAQAETLLRQLVPMWREAQKYSSKDKIFCD